MVGSCDQLANVAIFSAIFILYAPVCTTDVMMVSAQYDWTLLQKRKHEKSNYMRWCIKEVVETRDKAVSTKNNPANIWSQVMQSKMYLYPPITNGLVEFQGNSYSPHLIGVEDTSLRTHYLSVQVNTNKSWQLHPQTTPTSLCLPASCIHLQLSIYCCLTPSETISGRVTWWSHDNWSYGNVSLGSCFCVQLRVHKVPPSLIIASRTCRAILSVASKSLSRPEAQTHLCRRKRRRRRRRWRRRKRRRRRKDRKRMDLRMKNLPNSVPERTKPQGKDVPMVKIRENQAKTETKNPFHICTHTHTHVCVCVYVCVGEHRCVTPWCVPRRMGSWSLPEG